mmetsp:Transcript_21983/g.32470  ORF Transcript_21983/g.32470 Transcript_21983/m.32470 type:complete len:212 (+) Transcript_21983:103-738(+)
MKKRRSSSIDFLFRRRSSAEMETNLEVLKSFRRSQNNNEKKEVSFSRKVNISETLNCVDYTEEERQSCWYNVEEIEYIKRSNELTISMFRDKYIECDTDDHCSRGLEEGIIDGGKRKRRDTIKITQLAVLGQQWYQICNSSRNPDEIMACYIEASEASRLEARRKGLMDELQIFGRKTVEQRKQTDRMMRRMTRRKSSSLRNIWALLQGTA